MSNHGCLPEGAATGSELCLPLDIASHVASYNITILSEIHSYS